MRREFTLINVILIFHALFYGTLLLIAQSNYWVFLDFLSQPLAEDVFAHGEEKQYNFIDAITYLFYLSHDAIKEFFLNTLIAINSYNLITSLLILNAVLLAFSVSYLAINYKNQINQALVALSLVMITTSFFVNEDVTKADVDEAWLRDGNRDTTGIDLIEFLRKDNYKTVDKVFSMVHRKFMAGELNELEYEKEFAKITSRSKVNLPYVNEWVKNTDFKDIALSARGWYYEELGWQARGTKYSSKTSEDQFKSMRKYFKLAIDDHREALSINKKSLIAYRSLINIASAGDVDYDRGALYEKARQVFPGSYILSSNYIKKLQPKWGGSFKEMRKLAIAERKYAAKDPKLMSLGGEELLFRGHAHYKAKNYEGAIQRYKQSLLYSPRVGYFKEVYFFYSALKDYESAKKTLDDCLEFRPDSNTCIVYRAVTNIRLNDGTAALADATLGSANKGLGGWHMSNLAWVFERVSKLKKAIVLHKKSLLISPTDQYSLERLYDLSHKKHVTYEEVLPYFKTAVEHEPKNSQYWLWYADTLEDIDRNASVTAYKNYVKYVDIKDDSQRETLQYVKDTIKKIENRTKRIGDK